jgi:HEAT repeat protein
LTPLGTQEQVPAILAVLTKAKDDSERSAIEKALGGIASRVGEGLLPTILDAMKDGAVESRVVLLRVVARVGGAGALEAVRAALSSAEAPIAEESVCVLSEWPSLDAVPVLFELAKSADLGRQVLGLRGYVRLAGIEPSVETKSKMLVDAMALVKRPDEKKVVLGGWGAVPTLQALDVLIAYLDDADVRNEAGVAITAVAEQLGKQPANKPRAIESLQAVIDKCADSGIRERATKTLKKLP